MKNIKQKWIDYGEYRTLKEIMEEKKIAYLKYLRKQNDEHNKI